MSSLPSLSQSIKPTPPLMDSIMYRLSEEEICETVKPACLLTSSNRGVEGALRVCAQAVQPNSRIPVHFMLRMQKRYGSTAQRSSIPSSRLTTSGKSRLHPRSRSIEESYRSY